MTGINMFENIGTWYSLLHEVNLFSIMIRISMALFMGGVLGAERGLRNRPAGFMTYVLVCMGAAMIMLTNQYIFTVYAQTDPTRMAAQVVSGIGFLGAGTIIVTRNDEVHGLTTAAGLWLAAGLGLAIGIGFYSGAIVGFLFSIFALIILKKQEGAHSSTPPAVSYRAPRPNLRLTFLRSFSAASLRLASSTALFLLPPDRKPA